MLRLLQAADLAEPGALLDAHAAATAGRHGRAVDRETLDHEQLGEAFGHGHGHL